MEKKIKTVEKLARDLLSKLNLSGEAEAKSDGQSILLDIELSDPGILIGRNGQTLSDLQYLLRLMTNHQLGEFTYLTIDINGYRQRQKEQVEEEAARVIELVRETRRAQLLSPMPAACRKVVHVLIKEEEGLGTQSVGEDPNRRVLIRIEEES